MNLPLRKAVAEKLGWSVQYLNGFETWACLKPSGEALFIADNEAKCWRDAPHFESDITHAFPIAEKCGYAVIPLGNKWWACPSRELTLPSTIQFIDYGPYMLFLSDSPAEAICRCFLKEDSR